MEKEKIDKVFLLIEKMRDRCNDEESPITKDEFLLFIRITERLLIKVDDLQEEVEHLKDENEALNFALHDKKIESSSNRRIPRRQTRRNEGWF